MAGSGKQKYFTIVTGQTINADEDFFRNLHKHQPNLQKVSSVEKCDFILVFCPVVSRAGTDIEAALKKLNDKSTTKPAVLVVLHHTFDSEFTVPDSSRAVTRENTLTVDCLFYEDRGLLQCRKNDTALEKIKQYLKPQKSASALISRDGAVSSQPSAQPLMEPLLQTNQSNADQGTGQVTKPAVLVVLHHTFGPQLIVPDSIRSVNREKTLTVDCLFHEDKGLLQCLKNDKVQAAGKTKAKDLEVQHLRTELKELKTQFAELAKRAISCSTEEAEPSQLLTSVSVGLSPTPEVTALRKQVKRLQHKVEENFRLDLCEKEHQLGSAIILSCHLSPEISAVAMEIRWFKETDCVCLYKNRQVTEGIGYKGRVNLSTEELQRGNISLQIRDCRWSDAGGYLCQVIDGDTTEEISAEVKGGRYFKPHFT
ncbi:hypothetical protein MHYP_G00277410 [Metynnis hypsauchen]